MCSDQGSRGIVRVVALRAQRNQCPWWWHGRHARRERVQVLPLRNGIDGRETSGRSEGVRRVDMGDLREGRIPICEGHCDCRYTPRQATGGWVGGVPQMWMYPSAVVPHSCLERTPPLTSAIVRTPPSSTHDSNLQVDLRQLKTACDAVTGKSGLHAPSKLLILPPLRHTWFSAVVDLPVWLYAYIQSWCT